ncbi:MAG: N-acetylmuramoyl-L-alanine amidase, partial [Ruminococcus sp.]|nr:N-acetylmuramoyl-L-alanine amidase [Ruminococcus sp.]
MALTLCAGTLAGCGDTDSSSAAETTAATTTTAAESAVPAESAADNSNEEEALEEGIEELDEKAEDAGDDIDVDEYIANVLNDGAEPGEEVTPVADDNIDEDEISRSNSILVEYQKLSPNRTEPRQHKIDTITIHCMAGQLSIETCGNVFASSNAQASSNYGVGKDGRIALYVPESDRSWCSSNIQNDNRAVTIEVASDSYAPYAVSDAAYRSTIRLVADIC